MCTKCLLFIFGTTTDMIIIIISLVILWNLSHFLLLHHSHLQGLITQSIIYCGQWNHETWSDRSPSPDSPLCLGDSCESSPSPRCSHIPVIVHSPTGRLCSFATSHHTQPCRAVSARPWAKTTQAWTFPFDTEGGDRGDVALQTLLGFLQMFSDSDRSKRGEDGEEEKGGHKLRGLSPQHSGGCLRGKQVGRSVMREDSWQVQRRLTAKLRWQRGNRRAQSRVFMEEVFGWFF